MSFVFVAAVHGSALAGQRDGSGRPTTMPLPLSSSHRQALSLGRSCSTATARSDTAPARGAVVWAGAVEFAERQQSSTDEAMLRSSTRRTGYWNNSTMRPRWISHEPASLKHQGSGDQVRWKEQMSRRGDVDRQPGLADNAHIVIVVTALKGATGSRGSATMEHSSRLAMLPVLGRPTVAAYAVVIRTSTTQPRSGQL